MAYVINDGDKPTSQFQQFCDLCCLAYNELRRHSHLFISLLSLVCGGEEMKEEHLIPFSPSPFIFLSPSFLPSFLLPPSLPPQMLSCGLPELSSTDDIQYVRDALLPGKTKAEATYAFTK